jgi:hypothetical protein
MIFPNIFSAYDTRDLPNITIGGGATEAQVSADIRRWAAYFEGIVDMYDRLLIGDRGSDAQGTFGTGTAGGELQPYTEWAETEATMTEENEWAWGAPIRRWRDRQIYTEEYLATASLAQIAQDTVAATNRYLTTRLKSLIRATVRNTSWSFKETTAFPGESRRTITILPLFNNDANTGRMYVNNAIVTTGTLQHYLPSGAATIGINNFNLGRSTLAALGYTGRVIHLISAQDEATVKQIAGFIPVASDAQPYVDDPAAVPAATAVVTQPRAIGSFQNGTSDGEVISFPYWPAGYTFSFDATKEAPVYLREHSNAQFRGFRLVQNEKLGAYGVAAIRNQRWEWIAGHGVRNRANGVVVRAHATTYVPPTV